MPKLKKRVILIQDYDGCYSIAGPMGLHFELNGVNAVIYNDPQYALFKELVKKIPDIYRDYLSTITEDADAVSVYVGSDRQSKRLDDLNEARNKNGSVFMALKALCIERHSAACSWTFEPYLLADGDQPRGTALAKIESGVGPHPHEPYFGKVTETGRQSKIPMLTLQMADAYREYPGEELVFHFVDDREDLIDDILKHLDPAAIPPGMTLKISRFDFIAFARKEEGALGFVGEIKGPMVGVCSSLTSPVLERMVAIAAAAGFFAPAPAPAPSIVEGGRAPGADETGPKRKREGS